jgi:hypothetical protein
VGAHNLAIARRREQKPFARFNAPKPQAAVRQISSSMVKKPLTASFGGRIPATFGKHSPHEGRCFFVEMVYM